MKIKHPYPSPYKLEQAIADCHDWVTPDELGKMACTALQMACRTLDHPGGFPVCKRGMGRRTLAEETAEMFDHLLQDHGYRNQVPGFSSASTEILKAWRVDTAEAEIQQNELQSCHGGALALSQTRSNHPLPPAKVQAYADRNGIPPTLSPRRQDIHRRASQNEKTED